MIEVRQGGLVFKWPARSRRLLVFNKGGAQLAEVAVGNAFDSRPAELDDVHEVIEDYISGLTNLS